MVAKKIIIKLMQDVLGEYITNIPPSSLSVFLLRGKVKLENVQLDGDLIGSHVLSTMGLSGFAVLSCTARTLRFSIPWGKLEKEPTVIELSGVQLVCVPLLPSNAMRVFGSGTRHDPKCTLRTRVKRSALARFERNFFGWRIPGEGPKRPAEKARKRRRRRNQDGTESVRSNMNWDEQSQAGSVFTMDFREDSSVVSNAESVFTADGGQNDKEFSDGQRNLWRQKLAAKLTKNIHLSWNDVHIRCEVGKNALDVSQDVMNSPSPNVPQSNNASTANSTSSSNREEDDLSDADNRSFAFGMNVDTMLFKSANSNWQTGKNVDWTIDEKDKKQNTNASVNGMEAKEPEKRNYVLDVSNLAIYWDDSPPLLLSESHVFQFSNHQLSEHKVLTIVRKAMEKLKDHQDPGPLIRRMLETGELKSPSTTQIRKNADNSVPSLDHVYLLRKTNMKLRVEMTNTPEVHMPNICSAELIPCTIDMSFSPQQLRQRRLLEYTMMGQRRLDTMLHQRPSQRPTEDPRGWWRYVISCVITCPNRRSWRDIKTIVSKRAQYIGLVEKKHLKRALTETEREVLLRLEDALPIETLLAFHLVALRNVVDKREQRFSRRRRRKDTSASVVSAQEDDLDSVAGGNSVFSGMSMSRSPFRKRSKSRARKDLDESVVSMNRGVKSLNLHDELPRQLALPRSPLSKLPAIMRKGRRKSPLKDMSSMRVLGGEDNESDTDFVDNFDLLETSSETASHIDFGGVVPETYEEEIIQTPPMIRMIRGFNITISAALLDKVGGDPVMIGTLDASMWAKHSLESGITFLFDVNRLDCTDCTDANHTKVLTFDVADRTDNKRSNDDSKSIDDTSEITLATELRAPMSYDDDNFLDSFCEQMLEEDMPLPPRGIVCRFLIGHNIRRRSISLSAHAATLVWKTGCIRAFMKSFFPNQSQEARSVLGTQLRNAATPLALRAQVALISPKSMSIKVNIDAPKIWFPVSSDASDGALFVDSGRLNVSLSKPELVANIHYAINSSGMYANFRKSDSVRDIRDYCGSDGISILSPFDFSLEARRSGDCPELVKTEDGVKYEQYKQTNLSFTAISVNLVDVEVLALAIGRWYAAEMSSLKSKRSRDERSQRKRSRLIENVQVDDTAVEELSVSIESVELYLQGQVSPKMDNTQKRTYRIQILNIDAKHFNQGHKGRSNIKVGDASIVQESIKKIWDRQFEASNELRHKFLTCSAPKRRKLERRCHNNELGHSSILVTVQRDRKTLSNDFDIKFGRIVLRLTPTMLTDCSVAIGRIIESTQIMTKEMERRVHIESRQILISESRDEILKSKSAQSYGTSAVSSVTLNRYAYSQDQSSVTLNRFDKDHSRVDIPDSMFVVKATVEDAVLQIGWDEDCLESNNERESNHFKSIVQISFRILLMLQSTENLDGSGKRVLHASFDNFWVAMIHDFSIMSIRRCKPIINPFACEFRSVSSTAQFGEAVLSQDFAVDSDSIGITVETHNLIYLVHMFRDFIRECKLLGSNLIPKTANPNISKQPARKGRSSIATTMGFQFQPWSFTLLSKVNPNVAITQPLLNMKGAASGKFDGYTCALSGECRIESSIYFYSRNADGWVHLMETLPLSVELEYQPDDVVLSATFDRRIAFNVTSEMLERFSQETEKNSTESLKKPRVESVKKRIQILNDTGVNFILAPMRSDINDELSETESLDSSFIEMRSKSLRNGCVEYITDYGNMSAVGLILNEPDGGPIGSRNPILDLPLHSTKETEVFFFTPKSTEDSENTSDSNIEPVVEYCIQNQRLRSAFNNVSNLDVGTDLLSSQYWSPSDQIYNHGYGNHWLHPYLDGDVPEWSDTTFCLKLDKSRSMLPDNKWVWANDWEVDVSGVLDVEIDADGWDYAEDFKKFDGKKRFYREGDTCRRRKWTRTRLMKKQMYDDIIRPIPLVWSSSEKDGDRQIRITSHVKIINRTETKVSLLGFKYSWESDRYLGDVAAAKQFVVPIQFSSITHLRLAIIEGADNIVGQSFPQSKRFLILPTNHSCHRLHRTEIYLDSTTTTEELLASRSLHFLISIDCSNGIIKISIDPVMRVANFLPCPVQYRLLDAARQSDHDELDGGKATEDITLTEEKQIAVGSEICSLDANPQMNPSISFRVSGYQWSSYQKIINRSNAETSWKPDKHERSLRYMATNNGEQSGVYVSVVEFKSVFPDGDPLTVLMEVSSGHCPSIKIYAQFWISDMSSFGLRFCDGANDLIRTNLVLSKDRRAYCKRKDDIQISGHEWAIGKSGMSLYFSAKKKIAVTVDVHKGDSSGRPERSVRSGWSRLLDISNLMPKTVFSVDELNSSRRYDLCYDVTNAPSAFARTKIVRLFSRFHVINLSSSALYLMQEGCPGAVSFVHPEGSVPFHWEDYTKPNKIRLSTNCVNWSQGSVPIDKVGITSIKLHDTSEESPVLQVEVRLAQKDHNGAVAILVWNSEEKSQPLYVLQNSSSYKILCCQQTKEVEKDPEDDDEDEDGMNPLSAVFNCAPSAPMINVTDYMSNGINCGFPSSEVNFVGDASQWTLEQGAVKHFGFDYPQREHILEWIVSGVGMTSRETIELDTIGSNRVVSLPNGGKISCLVKAEGSSKVVEFIDLPFGLHGNEGLMAHFGTTSQQNSILSGFLGEDLLTNSQHLAIGIKVIMPGVAVSMIETYDSKEAGREILFLSIDQLAIYLGQTAEGYHEMELKISAIQIDNHLSRASHPTLFSFLHRTKEPVFHFSVVRKIRKESDSFVYRYVAIRLLDTNIALDRRTTEAMTRFLKPIQNGNRSRNFDSESWVQEYTQQLRDDYDDAGLSSSDYRINHDRLYIEELHIHPTRITLTFAQEWNTSHSTPEGPAFLQYIQMIPSITDASLILTSFVVSRSFESPSVLKDIIRTHYVSQVTQHFFSLIGSLAILTGPADFLANIGTGVRDFFYEPINGLVHGPAEFFEGLENGSLSLVRGVFVGVVRGAANVTGVLNSNLVNLTDDSFIEERNAYHRNILDLNNSSKVSTMSDILALAGASIAHGVKSGAKGLVEEPMENFNRQGAAGFVKGMGQALVKAVVKPIVGIGDGAILMLQHVTDATDEEDTKIPAPKRLRRALLRKTSSKRNSVLLIPYDEKSAIVQRIIAGNENLDDAYLSHIYTDRYLLVASEQFLWIIERRTNIRELFRWEEISHFRSIEDRFMHIITFSKKGLRPKILELESKEIREDFSELLSIQDMKMTNASAWSFGNDAGDYITNDAEYKDLIGLKTKQTKHIFGSGNIEDTILDDIFEDEIQIVEDCFNRLKFLSSEVSTYFSSLDEEAWGLINAWRQFFSGIKSKHCLVAGFINCTCNDIQVKSTILLEGGSPCFHIPTRDYDELNNLLKPGGAIIFFSWGVPPSLNNEGRIHLMIETNTFTCNVLDRNSPLTSIEVLPGHSQKCIFVEKSVSDWWAKYWVLVK